MRDGLKGARIGVLRQAYERPTARHRSRARVQPRNRRSAARGSDGHRHGARARARFDPARSSGGRAIRFKYEFNAWLAAQGDRVPVKTIDEIIRSGKYHPSVQVRLENAQKFEPAPDSRPAARRVSACAKACVMP